MRYHSTGEVHLDFHGVTHSTIRYLLKHYGEDALREILRSTVRDVYASMQKKLAEGDVSELEEFWRYYAEREKSVFTIAPLPDGGIRMEVSGCACMKHLEKLGLPFDPDFCRASKLFNEFLCEGTPFQAEFVKDSPRSCVQIIRKRGEK